VLSFGFKLAGAGIAVLLLGVLAFLLFSALWIRIGLGAAMVLIFGGLLFFVWRSQQKDRESRAGLKRI
jgi:Flp pilus assembly protein TadB